MNVAKLAAIGAATLVVAGLGLGTGIALWPRQECSNGVVAGEATIGGPFELVTHRGDIVTDAEILKSPSLVYFGFTYCPDVCPLDVARNLEAVDLLDAQGIEVQPVFVTIDPDRDTPQSLADYVEINHPRMVGLTGSQEQIEAAAKQYRVYYRKNGEGDDYLMDHSTFTYLMDANGFLDFFKRGDSPETVAAKVSCHLS